MPVSFSHPQTFRSKPPRQCRPPSPPAPPSLPHLVLGLGNLYSCVCGVPLFSKGSVTISCYQIRKSPSQSSSTSSSLTNAEFDGPLRDSEEIHCAALPLCLLVGPSFSGGPNSPLAEAHHLSRDRCVSTATGVSIFDVCINSFPSLNRSALLGPRVGINWTANPIYGDSPKTRLRIFGGFTEIPFVLKVLVAACTKLLPVVSPVSVLIGSSYSLKEKLSSPYPLPMERGVSSDSLSRACFRFFISLYSCVAVSTGPEDAIEIASVNFVDEVWTSTSLFVTILLLSDTVVKAVSTHSSIVLNPLSTSFEDLSCLSDLVIVVYLYCQRGWIMPSHCCIAED